MTNDAFFPRADEVFLSVAEVARRLSVSRLTIYRLIERRTLPVHRIARRLRVAPEDVRQYLRGTRTEQGYDGPKD
jgi:excisionase family DNA binding protein